MLKTQNYQNHVRYYPLFHYVLVPLLAINLIYQALRLYQEPNWDRGMFVLLSSLFIFMMIVARLHALRVQDRLIRLEEKLRHREIIPGGTNGDIELSQVIALRFASDEELPGLVQKVTSGELKTGKEIKQAIKNWRADHHRV
jgi:hypothetical protein